MTLKERVAKVIRRPKIVFLLAALLVLGAGAWYLLGSGSASSQGFISESDYVSTRIGEGQAVVQSRLGAPLPLSDVPDVLPAPPGESCIYYQDNVPTIDGTIYRLCFRNGVLATKDGYGPLFDSPPLNTASPSASSSA